MRIPVVVHTDGHYQILELPSVNSITLTCCCITLEGFYFLKDGFVAEIFRFSCIWLYVLHYILDIWFVS